MEEKTLVHGQESTPGSGFLYREDYLLFGLLVRHGLCNPEDMSVLIRAQHDHPEQLSIARILGESSNLPEKARKDIDELLRILATPQLRNLLPGELPDVRTLVETLADTRRDRPAAAARTEVEPHSAPTEVTPSSGKSTTAGVSGVSSTLSFGSIAGDLSTHLTDDEKHRVQRSRQKSDLIGRSLSGHILIDKLGTGGQGDVYLAKQVSLNRYVALKRLYIPQNAQADDFLQAFRLEAQTLGRINHARIVKVYEIFMDQGIAFFSMEYLNGRTLKEMVVESGGGVRVDVVANLACQACSALARTAEDGLVHRDIKPANMMVDTNGDLKIVDFGLAGLAAGFGGGEGFSGTPSTPPPSRSRARSSPRSATCTPSASPSTTASPANSPSRRPTPRPSCAPRSTRRRASPPSSIPSSRAMSIASSCA